MPDFPEVNNATEGVLFLGSGPSTCVPQLHHVLNFGSPSQEARPRDTSCKVCYNAWLNPGDPNVRLNVSLLIKILKKSDQSTIPRAFYHTLVDMGKSFREAALKWFPRNSVGKVDCVLLTHDHADAVGGLDDIRDVQGHFNYVGKKNGDVYFEPVSKLPLYLSQKTYESVKQSFGYIVSASESIHPVNRKVGIVEFIKFEGMPASQRGEEDTDLIYGEFVLFDRLKVELIPVYHGEHYVSMGYLFGEKNRSDLCLYISDISEIPEQSLKVLDARAPFDIMVIDALFENDPHFSHLCVEEALDFVERWRPKQAYIVGFTCRKDYNSLNMDLEIARVKINAGEREPRYAEKPEGLSVDEYRPLKTRKLLKSRPLNLSDRKIDSIQLAKDGLFVPLSWRT